MQPILILAWCGLVSVATDDDVPPPGTRFTVTSIVTTIRNIEPKIVTLKGGDTVPLALPTAVQVLPSGRGVSARETSQTIVLELSADVLFDFDSARLRDSAEVALREVARLIVAKARHGVRIEGHTDSKGSDEYNLRLSIDRAESVRQWLVGNGGLDPAILTTAGLGESRPVAPNTTMSGDDDPVGRQKNRRVEMTIGK